MCCGRCNKWQHIPCHDSRDARMGRPKRDWNKIEFFCARCLATKLNGASQPAYPSNHSSTSQRYQHNYNNGTNGTSHHAQLPYGQVAGQSGWQPPPVSYGLKPAVPSAQGYPEPSAYAQSYLAPTSSVRSSTYGHPSHSGHATAGAHGQGYGGHAQTYGATAYGGGNISFSHYQPQERVFTNDAERVAQHGQQNSYYRVNGHGGYGYPQQQHQQVSTFQPGQRRDGLTCALQSYPPHQRGWTGGANNHYAPSASSYPPSAASYGNSGAQRSTYDGLARDAPAYRQQVTPPAPVQTQPPLPAAAAPTTNGHYARAAGYPPS